MPVLIPFVINMLLINIPYLSLTIYKIIRKYQQQRQSNLTQQKIQKELEQEHNAQPKLVIGSNITHSPRSQIKKQVEQNNCSQEEQQIIVELSEPYVQDQQQTPLQTTLPNQYFRVNNVLWISTIAFLQAVLSRIYFDITEQELLFPDLLLLIYLNLLLHPLIFNGLYNYIIYLLHQQFKTSIQIHQFFIIEYNLLIIYALQYGLETYCQYDSIGTILTIIQAIPLQIAIQRKWKSFNINILIYD